MSKATDLAWAGACVYGNSYTRSDARAEAELLNAILAPVAESN